MRLQQQVQDLARQVADLRRQLDCQTADLLLQQTRSDDERDRLRTQAADSASQLQHVKGELQRLAGERDRAANALLSARSQVSSARAAVSRLERQVADLQPDRCRVETLQRENVRLIHDLASADAVRVQLENERDQLRQDHGNLRDRVEGLISVVRPEHSASSRPASVPGRRSPSRSPPSRRSERLGRRRRSSSSGSSTHRARTRRRLHRSPPHNRSASPSSPSVLGRGRLRFPASPRRSTSPAGSAARTHDGRLRAGNRGRSVTSRPLSPSSSDAESLRAALARSRSSDRRRRQSSGSPNRPISVDSPDSAGHGSPPHSASPQSDRGQDGDGGSSGGSDANSDNSDSYSSGSDGSVPRRSLTPRNMVLSIAAYGLLDPTTVPRDQWIPGYRERVRRADAGVRLWDPRYVRRICVLELDIELLFHHFTKPREWLFPARQPVPARVDWDAHLITEANIRALYDSRPWTALSVVVDPISFEVAGWFQPLTTQYRELEADCLQTLWESTHSFPLTPVTRRNSRFLDELWTDRKQRQSRFDARWKSFLKHVLRGIVAGHCGLDILLDPIFRHRPRMGEQKAWYPGFGTNPRPRDLIAAARSADLVEPWRLQYRAQPCRSHVSFISSCRLPTTSAVRLRFHSLISQYT